MISVPVASETGYTTMRANAGTVKNTGIEVSLGWNDKINGDFTYGINLNMAYNKNKVTKINNESHYIEGGRDLIAQNTGYMARMQEGHPIGYFYGYKTAGVMQNQADAKNIKIDIGALNLVKLKSDQNLLMIVLRNLLQNAINHSFNDTSILLNAENPNQQPIISIVNQGAQITTEKIDELLSNNNVNSKSSGYGLLIVKELLQKLNATLQIESLENATTMKIIFK